MDVNHVITLKDRKLMLVKNRSKFMNHIALP